MTELAPTDVKNLDRYGDDALPWSRVRDALVASPLRPDTRFYLGTTSPDGQPHAAGIGALWHAGELYFTSSLDTRKSRDLAANPTCSISCGLEGIDVVFEGTAIRVTDTSALEQVAALYREGGWPAEVEGDAFTAPYSAPSAGPPPWYLYRLAYHTVFAVAAAEPNGATRWRFER